MNQNVCVCLVLHIICTYVTFNSYIIDVHNSKHNQSIRRTIFNKKILLTKFLNSHCHKSFLTDTMKGKTKINSSCLYQCVLYDLRKHFEQHNSVTDCPRTHRPKTAQERKQTFNSTGSHSETEKINKKCCC